LFVLESDELMAVWTDEPLGWLVFRVPLEFESMDWLMFITKSGFNKSNIFPMIGDFFTSSSGSIPSGVLLPYLVKLPLPVLIESFRPDLVAVIGCFALFVGLLFCYLFELLGLSFALNSLTFSSSAESSGPSFKLKFPFTMLSSPWSWKPSAELLLYILSLFSSYLLTLA
jgi:hypothetical protein